MSYQPFAISNFRTGFDESVEPWLLPRDAYQSVINAHLYRGVLQKILGYNLFATMSYRNVLNLGPDGIKKVFTGTLASLPKTTNFYVYGTIVDGTAEIMTYSGDDGINLTRIKLTGNAGGSGWVDITTGDYRIEFGTIPPNTTYSSAFIIWDSVVASPVAIMGIQPYFAQDSTQPVMVFDRKRVGIIVDIVGIIAAAAGANQGISEIPHDYYQSAVYTAGGGATFTATLTAKNLIPNTVYFNQYTSIGAFVSSVKDNGLGAITGVGVASGLINYTTGAFTITYSAPPTTGNVFDVTAGIYGDIFTGTISNFFTLYNYQYKAFFTNSVNLIMYYDGFSLHFLNTMLAPTLVTSVGGMPNNLDIDACLHVFVNRERLLLISPSIGRQPQTSAIYWSVAGSPLDFTNDEQLFASTSEPIRTFGYINTDLIIRFSNSERVFRYTSDAFSPFRWDSTNNIYACDAPYSSINYDTWFSAVGRPAITGSDGLNTKRIDDKIPDFTNPDVISQQLPVPFMSQSSIIQCYGERFDDIKEGWLCYNSKPPGQSQITPSDNVLSFNYLDETYAIYSFPLSCTGLGRVTTGATWSQMQDTWEETEDTWGSYLLQNNALTDLGGDQFDRVWQLNTGSFCTNVAGNLVPIQMSVFTKNLNPFIEQGELARFGYVDLLVSANAETKLRVQFYVNDNLYFDANNDPAGYYQETTLTFTPTNSMSPTRLQTKIWKRVYVGSVATIHTMRFYQSSEDLAVNPDMPVYIHAMVLYMKPAGRIFN